MDEVRVNSWNDLQEQLFADAWNPGISRFRSPFVFRGVGDASLHMENSLMRLGNNYAEMEPHLLRNFRKYARRSMVEQDNFWHWLSLAQHHGLPTRLLDWTISPLVSVHFALENIQRFDIDSAIWVINYNRSNDLLPKRFRQALEREGAEFFTVEILAGLVESLEDLNRASSDPFVLFFEPPSLDERIVNQYAVFSLISDVNASMDAWISQHPDLCRKIIIPAELHWQFRDYLDQSNITERVLFPGLDGLSRWLKRYYTPKRNNDLSLKDLDNER